MALIEHREMPHRDIFELVLYFDAALGITPPTGNEDVAFPWIASKRAWLLGMTVHTQVLSTLAATLQLETFASGAIVATSGGSVVASEKLLLDGPEVVAGDIVTSDMGLAQLINDRETGNNANITDVLDMAGKGGSALVVVETPIQIEEGGGCNLRFADASAAAWVGTVTIWLTEHPI